MLELYESSFVPINTSSFEKVNFTCRGLYFTNS